MSSTLLRTAPALRGALKAGATKPVAAMASTAFVRGKATLPDISYDYGALEPYISSRIMELHHSKHHQTYVTGYNGALDKIEEAKSSGGDVAKVTESVSHLLNFHGGGHLNHTLFWENLSPASKDGGGEPAGALKKAIDESFGSFESYVKQTNAALAGIQGSGWAWLVKDTNTGGLNIITRPNQNTADVVVLDASTGPLGLPESTGTLVPLMGIDAWEHAYYLQYENRKAEYFDAIWNVINWKTVTTRFEKA